MAERSEHREERSFGLLVGGVFALIALAQGWHGRVIIAAVLGACGFGLIAAALVQPSWLRIPHALWRRLAQVLGWVNSRILLSVFFFALLTPMGLLARLTGWDPLQRARKAKQSGWRPYPLRLQDAKHYERMY